MKMQMTQSLQLKQEMRLAQVIEFANFLTVPDEVLNVVTGAISYNPDSIETVLQKRKEERSSPSDVGDKVGDKVQSLYASLNPSKGDPEARLKGMIISPDLRVLESRFEGYQATSTPDVTYIGRKDEKPEVVFSDHLQGAMRLVLLQIDSSKYPETARLLSQLRRFDEWKREKLRSAYVIIGGVQREFFESLDSSRFNIFTLEDLADKLEVSLGTVSRISSNRWVEARDVAGNQKFFYSKDLCVTKDDLTKYTALGPLNEILREEFERGKAYSDWEITNRLRGAARIARRTVNKYRLASGIPATRERNQAYEASERTEPYRIV